MIAVVNISDLGLFPKIFKIHEIFRKDSHNNNNNTVINISIYSNIGIFFLRNLCNYVIKSCWENKMI